MPSHSDDTNEISRTASVADMRRIEDKLDTLDHKLDGLAEKHNEVNVWRATIDARLAAGVEKMLTLENSIAKCASKETVSNIKDSIEDCATSVELDNVKKTVEGCVEKKILWAYLVGFGTAAGGIGATLTKLFYGK